MNTIVRIAGFVTQKEGLCDKGKMTGIVLDTICPRDMVTKGRSTK